MFSEQKMKSIFYGGNNSSAKLQQMRRAGEIWIIGLIKITLSVPQKHQGDPEAAIFD